MSLEAVVETLDKVPTELRPFYKEVDGRHVLDVAGVKTQADFDNYAEALKKRYADNAADLARASNSGVTRDEIMSHIEDAMKKFAPAATAGGKTTNGQVEGGELAQKLHDLERNLAAVTTKLETVTKERDEALGTSRSTTINNALTQAATAAGVRPEGVQNLVALVSDNFELSADGQVVTKLEAGQGITPNQNPTDYFTSLGRAKEFRMFWPASKGAGADGDSGAAGGSGDLGKGNPWTKGGWNVTAQGKLFRENKAEAERLMKAAGFKPGMTSPVK